MQQTPNNNVSKPYGRAQGHLLGVANTTNNACTPSYSLYGPQYTHQVPNPSPSVQEPGVRPVTTMSQKIAVTDEVGQQYLAEGSSYQRPYILDNEDGLQSETPSPVVSSQEDQSPTTKEQLQPLPRPPTYHEHTGGTLTNQPPWRTGVTANMDFKTKTFIDAHGATFATNKCGPYRFVKPKNRDQELAIIKATYQTIVDFELYLGYSPQGKIQTWNSSYDEQYIQLQRELIKQWYVDFRPFFICPISQGHTDFPNLLRTGPWELIPKLRYVEGWYTSLADHSAPTPPEPDSTGNRFAWCKPGSTEGKPCFHHNYQFWQERGCVRGLEEQYWQDHGNAFFARVEATSTHVSAGNYAEEDWKERRARMERAGRQQR